MYFFYFDESGTRDPSLGTPEKPKDHLYVLLAVGMFEQKWRPFERAITLLKLELADHARRTGRGGPFDLAECEVKSTWVRIPEVRKRQSPFLSALSDQDLNRLVKCYFAQLKERRMVIMAAVIDKRYLRDFVDQEILHKKAYEFLLERIENYMAMFHPKHNALIVMDDTSKQLNQAVAMKHAWFQRSGNQNTKFRHIVEYPFFTRSELSNGIQLADLLAYNVHRAFRSKMFDYPFFVEMFPYFYRREHGTLLNGLKVWPEESPLFEAAKTAWRQHCENENLGLDVT